MKPQLKYDLGGTGGRAGYTSVNLAGHPDIIADITDLDSFCADGTVDEFLLNHTLEHIPCHKYSRFLRHMLRKLKRGGCVRVIQTDCAGLMRDFANGKISFRAARLCVFPPSWQADTSILNAHRNMWGADELVEDFTACGYDAIAFDAGSWRFNCPDEFIDLKPEFGKPIPNLGVIAKRK